MKARIIFYGRIHFSDNNKNRLEVALSVVYQSEFYYRFTKDDKAHNLELFNDLKINKGCKMIEQWTARGMWRDETNFRHRTTCGIRFKGDDADRAGLLRSDWKGAARNCFCIGTFSYLCVCASDYCWNRPQTINCYFQESTVISAEKATTHATATAALHIRLDLPTGKSACATRHAVPRIPTRYFISWEGTR